ncbi:hypothetical protein HID58_024348 [Brassica napus]|uniref:Uncharacterized protein n=1 Tax=Brassica napus TaxID=3708 RepID=A0ABQ8D4P6_BRANA|nr:hypothetical protein HID58_024348 [Brassica napus]
MIESSCAKQAATSMDMKNRKKITNEHPKKLLDVTRPRLEDEAVQRNGGREIAVWFQKWKAMWKNTQLKHLYEK